MKTMRKKSATKRQVIKQKKKILQKVIYGENVAADFSNVIGCNSQ